MLATHSFFGQYGQMLAICLGLLHGYYMLRALLWAYLWHSGEKATPPKRPRHLSNLDVTLKTAVLLPMYKEAKVVGELVLNLTRLWYPAGMVRYFFVVEEDDVATRRACEVAIKGHRDKELVLIPALKAGEHRGKPRALNHAMKRVYDKFDIVVVYDAEDEPAGDQLLLAEQEFRLSDERLAVVQAQLRYRNHNESWLTALFAAEYEVWFGCLLRGLSALGWPIPLGGTSNFVSVPILKRVGGWDQLNVTEDCELGMRLARYGYEARYLGSVTTEDAITNVGGWIRQRSRWSKGFMYTVLTSKRPPGFGGAVVWHLFVAGAPVVAMLNPFMWLVTAAWWCEWIPRTALFAESWQFWTAFACLLVGTTIHIGLPLLADLRTGKRWRSLLNLTLPAYWVLHSIAGWIALWELYRRPHSWAKTEHRAANERPDGRKK